MPLGRADHGTHEQVIITSFLFPEGKFSQERLDGVLKALGGDKSKLVIDLSCRRRGEDSWFVAMNKWQTITDMEVNSGECESRPYTLPPDGYSLVVVANTSH